jgi:hypothetical protein
MSDLERAFKALSDKGANYKKLFDYYDGAQPLTYTAKRLEEIFRGLDAVFTENWCSVVVDSVRDRINLSSIVISDLGQTQAAWKQMWEDSQLELESDDVHEAALVAGESYVVVWPDEDGWPQAYYNDPRLCHVFYEQENPRRKKYAAKWWRGEDEKLHMTLYYPDRLEYYASANKADSVNAASGLTAKGTVNDNPYGEIPVFHFRTVRRTVKSDLANVIPVQNGINKLLTDMMVAAEYGAFKQRYVISNAETLGKLKNAPNEIWELPAGDGMSQQTVAGEFAATDLDNYLKAIENLATAISTITRTPKHYFFSIGSNLSGEALIAMEAPLNKKAQDRIDRFTPVWRDVAAFMLKVAGMPVEREKIQPIFDKPEMIQPRTEAETVQLMVAAGMPLNTALRNVGWEEGRIGEMMKDAEAATMRQEVGLATALLNAERQFNGGGGG